MTLKEARQTMELGATATRQEIKKAYRRLARRWHPDRAPAGEEAAFRMRMQEINAAYQRLKDFVENYRYRLDEPEAPEDPADIEKWWKTRFGGTGVWGAPPPKKDRGGGD
jgi:curved DNA-binding protein